MLIVAPMGKTKRDTLESIPLLFSKLEIVTGKVAELEAVANAVNKACDIPLRKRIKSEYVSKKYMSRNLERKLPSMSCKIFLIFGITQIPIFLIVFDQRFRSQSIKSMIQIGVYPWIDDFSCI